MSTFALVCVQKRVPADFFTLTNPGGISRLRPHDPEQNLFIDTKSGSYQDVQTAAKLASAETDTAVFAFYGVTSVDTYEVTELLRGEVVRYIAYGGEAGGWQEPQGVARPWERDLHFAEALDECIASREDWSESELAGIRKAYDALDWTLFPRLPPITRSQFTAFMEGLGYDFKAGAHARYERVGFFQRFIRSVGI